MFLEYEKEELLYWRLDANLRNV